MESCSWDDDEGFTGMSFLDVGEGRWVVVDGKGSGKTAKLTIKMTPKMAKRLNCRGEDHALRRDWGDVGIGELSLESCVFEPCCSSCVEVRLGSWPGENRARPEFVVGSAVAMHCC